MAPANSPAPAAAPNATGDVSVTQCQIDPNDSTLADVGGTIINHDSQSDDYIVTITLLEGSTRVGEALDSENSIAAGQTSNWTSTGTISGGTGAGLICQVASVNRYSSN